MVNYIYDVVKYLTNNSALVLDIGDNSDDHRGKLFIKYAILSKHGVVKVTTYANSDLELFEKIKKEALARPVLESELNDMPEILQTLICSTKR